MKIDCIFLVQKGRLCVQRFNYKPARVILNPATYLNSSAILITYILLERKPKNIQINAFLIFQNDLHSCLLFEINCCTDIMYEMTLINRSFGTWIKNVMWKHFKKKGDFRLICTIIEMEVALICRCMPVHILRG